MVYFLQGRPIKAQWAMLVWTGKLLTAAANGAKNVENYGEQNEKKDRRTKRGKISDTCN